MTSKYIRNGFLGLSALAFTLFPSKNVSAKVIDNYKISPEVSIYHSETVEGSMKMPGNGLKVYGNLDLSKNKVLGNIKVDAQKYGGDYSYDNVKIAGFDVNACKASLTGGYKFNDVTIKGHSLGNFSPKTGFAMDTNKSNINLTEAPISISHQINNYGFLLGTDYSIGKINASLEGIVKSGTVEDRTSGLTSTMNQYNTNGSEIKLSGEYTFNEKLGLKVEGSVEEINSGGKTISNRLGAKLWKVIKGIKAIVGLERVAVTKDGTQSVGNTYKLYTGVGMDIGVSKWKNYSYF